jgi:hypothetical protein
MIRRAPVGAKAGAPDAPPPTECLPTLRSTRGLETCGRASGTVGRPCHNICATVPQHQGHPATTPPGLQHPWLTPPPSSALQERR